MVTNTGGIIITIMMINANMNHQDGYLHWGFYVFTACLFSIITISYVSHKEPEKIESAKLFVPAGPGEVKDPIHTSHIIERTERKIMPEVIGWEGFDQAVEDEYLRRKYAK